MQSGHGIRIHLQKVHPVTHVLHVFQSLQSISVFGLLSMQVNTLNTLCGSANRDLSVHTQRSARTRNRYCKLGRWYSERF